MGLFSRLFSSPPSNPVLPLQWDMHNHILFGIDDGSKTIDYSVDMARQFVELGYKKVYATPHVMSDYYPNTREIIAGRCTALQARLKEQHIPLELGFAAEYYMDEVFYDLIQQKGDVMSFNGRHVLVETSFMNKPVFFSKLLFDIRTGGYIPVLAHPERYVYFHENYEEMEQVLAAGVKFQINLLSLLGYYSPQVKKCATWLIENGHYSFLGTDAHSTEHLQLMKEVFASKLYSRIDFSKVENCKEEVAG